MRLKLAISVLVLLNALIPISVISAEQNDDDDNLDEIVQACDTRGCYDPSPFGGFGARPVRTFRVQYGDEPICKVIQQKLNETVRMDPIAAIARVTRPSTTAGKDKTYQTQNELFGDPMFLQWHSSNGSPINPETGGGDRQDRWLIVPFLNDGHNHLVTAIGATGSSGVSEFDVWDVPEDQLEKLDWSKPETYQPFRQATDDMYSKFQRRADPLSWNPHPASKPAVMPLPVDDASGFTGQSYGVLTLEKAQEYPWLISISGQPFYALYDGNYYTVQYSGFDAVAVEGTKNGFAKELCYIDSTISALEFQNSLQRSVKIQQRFVAKLKDSKQ